MNTMQRELRTIPSALREKLEISKILELGVDLFGNIDIFDIVS